MAIRFIARDIGKTQHCVCAARRHRFGVDLRFARQRKFPRRFRIDLTIKGDEIPFTEFMQIEDQIDDLMLPYTVDLSQYCQLENTDLVAHIDRVGVAIYSKR